MVLFKYRALLNIHIICLANRRSHIFNVFCFILINISASPNSILRLKFRFKNDYRILIRALIVIHVFYDLNLLCDLYDGLSFFYRSSLVVEPHVRITRLSHLKLLQSLFLYWKFKLISRLSTGEFLIVKIC